MTDGAGRADLRARALRFPGPWLLLALAALLGSVACSSGGGSSSPAFGAVTASTIPSGTAVTTDDLRGTIQVNQGGDPPPTFTWSWTRDGVDAGIAGPDVDSGATLKNQDWEVTVVADFGGTPTAPASAQLRIVNSPPVVSGAITFSPMGGVCTSGTPEEIGMVCSSNFDCGFILGVGFGTCSPAENGDLFVTPLTDDADGDPVTTTVEWFVNGVSAGTTNTLDNSLFVAGDIVQVSLTPNDGEEDGDPGISSVEIQPAPAAPALISLPSIPQPGVGSIEFAGASADSDASRTLLAEGLASQVPISITESDVCSIDADGAITCTGAEDSALTSPPEGSYSHVAAEEDYACAIRSDDQSIHCWGTPPEELGLLAPPEGSFVQIDVGLDTACGLRDSGEIACWGIDSPERTAPPEGAFNYLDVSDTYSCAIDAEGAVSCWGAPE